MQDLDLVLALEMVLDLGLAPVILADLDLDRSSQKVKNKMISN